MDSRITKIARSISSLSPNRLVGVAGIDSSWNPLKVDGFNVDTMFLMCPKDKTVVYFYTDSTRSYALRFIVLFQETDIKGDTYGGIRFSRTQKVPFTNNKDMTVLFFDEPMESSIDSFDRGGHPASDLREAILRASMSLFMFFVKKNPKRSFTAEYESDNFSYVEYKTEEDRTWDGSAHIRGSRQFQIDICCDGLNFSGRRPTQEEVFQILNNCFDCRIYTVDNVTAIDSPLACTLELEVTLN